MTTIQDLKGSICALVTPFNPDGSINYATFEALIDFHLANGTDGLVICGTTAETPTLTHEEDYELIRRAITRVQGRIPIIAGAGSNCTATAITSAQKAEEMGAEAVLIVGPYYNKPTANGFYEHFKAVAEAVSIPTILYNVPGRTGKNIPAEVILRLARDVKSIVAVKEASGNMDQIMTILQKRPEGFRVFSGDDALAFPMMALGADGCISVVANQIPKDFSAMIHAALEGDYKTARQIHFKYLTLMNLNFIESNPIPVKTGLSLMGMMEETFRLPMCKMEDANKEKLRTEMKSLGLLQA